MVNFLQLFVQILSLIITSCFLFVCYISRKPLLTCPHNCFFSPRRGYRRVLNFYMGSYVNKYYDSKQNKWCNLPDLFWSNYRLCLTLAIFLCKQPFLPLTCGNILFSFKTWNHIKITESPLLMLFVKLL